MGKNPKIDVDAIVVGGGMAGLTQSLMLSKCGLSVICFDKGRVGAANDRTTAISYGSSKILEKAGVWHDLADNACPIEDIRIIDGSSPVLLNFNADDGRRETSPEAFGWIIENKVISETLLKKAKNEKNITFIDNCEIRDFIPHDDCISIHLQDGKTYKAKLIIGADGRNSFTREYMEVGVREWSYKQVAFVTIVEHENPHNNVAVEHFRSEGPFAILPMLDDKNGKHRSSVVWTQHSSTDNILEYDKGTLLAALNTRFPAFYGSVTDVKMRLTYPLNFSHAYRYISQRMVLIGDAAHGIHPIAGQGLNLGFRDIECLTNLVHEANTKNVDIGLNDVLEKYQRIRAKDNIAMAATTDILNKVFSNDYKSIQTVRKIGLRMVQKIKPAKKFFMNYAMGLHGTKKSVSGKR